MTHIFLKESDTKLLEEVRVLLKDKNTGCIPNKKETVVCSLKITKNFCKLAEKYGFEGMEEYLNNL